ncbi:MAG TPA: ROK family protein [Thermodesulfovibrionales bacterium]|nr:ROK family protein [Thermodesulfovibrionales bacterium]
MKKKYAIGIDLGGTYLRIALVSEDGEVVQKIKIPSSENIVESLQGSIRTLLIEGVIGIGFGIAGLIDRQKETVVESPNLPRIEGLDIAGILRNTFNLPVVLENDANVAAMGEKWMGEGKPFKNFVLLTLGTGIGGGLIYNHVLMDIAAEIGHMSIMANGERCSCGNYGCLEAYASGTAILSRAIKSLEDAAESAVRESCKGNIYKLTPEDIYKAALDGDTLSREILRDAGRYLGVGISNLIHVFSPDALILTGGLIGAWNIFIQEAIKEASRRTFKQLFEKVSILPSSLGDDAGILGASHLVFACQRT